MFGKQLNGKSLMRRVIASTVFICGLTFAATPYEQSQALYHRTDYQAALKVLTPVEPKDGRTWELIGMSWFMQADYKRATDAFEHAIQMEPHNSEYVHCLGKAWGRRAESASPFMAPSYASRARQYFEQAVMLNPSNKEALNDLFDYCLQAPGFLGGGLNRAEVLVAKIEKLDPAEGHYARAQLLDKRKEFDAAEQQLRRAFELAPRQVGRVLDLAQYLSKRGRVQESEAAFAQAEKIAPNSPRLLYERAQTYIRDNRNLDQARELLKKYVSSTLTAEDPPREKALALLRKVNGA
jgi:cytochrome c-type biogenesis protein CcmH/NrfG